MASLEERVAAIEARNRTVEMEKAWETSPVRKVVIMVLTYLVVSAYLIAIEVERPFVNAIVPVVGFYLSTLAVGGIKRYWIRRRSG
jgi:hypothetical protein